MGGLYHNKASPQHPARCRINFALQTYRRQMALELGGWARWDESGSADAGFGCSRGRKGSCKGASRGLWAPTKAHAGFPCESTAAWKVEDDAGRVRLS